MTNKHTQYALSKFKDLYQTKADAPNYFYMTYASTETIWPYSRWLVGCKLKQKSPAICIQSLDNTFKLLNPTIRNFIWNEILNSIKLNYTTYSIPQHYVNDIKDININESDIIQYYFECLHELVFVAKESNTRIKNEKSKELKKSLGAFGKIHLIASNYMPINMIDVAESSLSYHKNYDKTSSEITDKIEKITSDICLKWKNNDT